MGCSPHDFPWYSRACLHRLAVLRVQACMWPVHAGICAYWWRVFFVTREVGFIEPLAKRVCLWWRGFGGGGHRGSRVAPPNEKLPSTSLSTTRSSPERPVHITVAVRWSEKHKQHKTKASFCSSERKELVLPSFILLSSDGVCWPAIWGEGKGGISVWLTTENRWDGRKVSLTRFQLLLPTSSQVRLKRGVTF